MTFLKKISFRLTVWYLTGFAILAICLGTGIYFSLSSKLRSNLDADLIARSDQIFRFRDIISIIASGTFDLRGKLPVNTSGGLLGRGAPVGATGIAQAIEVVEQLWGTVSPERQVHNARRGLTDTHAGIGTICVVNIFEKRD